MRHLFTIALSLVFFVGSAWGDDLDDRVATSRSAAQAFGAQLKAELQAALKDGGTLNGIAVCNQRAGEIADATSSKLGLSVGRTSLKVRNPDNLADDWEHAVLEQFEQRKSGGAPVAELEYHEVVEADGQSTFRYMKAIPTAKVCLACHGDALDSELDAKLAELYPEDQARGFQEGDIRGAFTISQPM